MTNAIDQKKVALNVSKVSSLFTKEEDNKAKIKDLQKVGKEKQKKIEALKAENTAINDKLVEVVANHDIFTACAIISLYSQSPRDAENAERQRMIRRRKRLVKETSKKHTDFDLVTEKIKNQAVIRPVYVGDEIIRKAKEINAKLAEYKELGLTVTISNVETIETKLRNKKASKDTVTVSDESLVVTDLAELLDNAKNAAEKERSKRSSKKQAL